MLYLHSHLLGKARKQAPTDAEATSHKLLSRAGFIDQAASGVFSLLPLGFLAQEKIKNVIREQMLPLPAAQVQLPALQPTALWQESGRFSTIDPPLFLVTDRHEKVLALGSTHEEIITDLARNNIESYKDLPLAVFQIQTKFRNELRPTGGLLRVREFQMKDLYSFHATSQDLETYYERVKQAYLTIFKTLDVTAHVVKASSGTIGGAVSHEFSVEADAGEDKVAVCSQCGYAANVEVLQEGEAVCPSCGGAFEIRACIENGHIFQLGTIYSEKMGALFTNEAGSKQPIFMGCYGIGVGRLLATVVETHHDGAGMVWPASASPMDVHVVALKDEVKMQAHEIASTLAKEVDVLLDDRDFSAGQKFAESDLIGIPKRVVISPKTVEKNELEVVDRATKQTVMMSLQQFMDTL